MDDLRQEGPPNGNYDEIRLLFLPGAVIAAVRGIIVDMPVVSFVAICKGPYMLFKGWSFLTHDLVGREGPFLETICVPFAGLAILLWPLAVVGAVLASMLASTLLDAYAGVVAYQCDKVQSSNTFSHWNICCYRLIMRLDERLCEFVIEPRMRRG